MALRLAQLERQFVKPDTNDRFPVHHGARSTVAAIGNAMRYAEQGDRQLWVDVLRELIEGDPHAFSVLSKRFSAVANKPWEMIPAQVEDEREKEAAAEIAAFVERAIRAIPRWQTHCRGLLWGNFYSVSMREVMWKRTRDAVLIDRLEFVHSRRLDYDDQFRLHVTDGYGNSTGVMPKDPAWFGKFVVLESQLSDEYPTREGLGRIIAQTMGFKRFAWRDLLVFVESRGKSFVDVTWKSGNDATAETSDIDAAKLIAQKVAAGLGSAAHSDTVKVDFKGQGAQSGAAGSNTPHLGLIDLCDNQESEAVLGGHLTTGTTKRGEGAQAQTQEGQQDELTMADGRAWDNVVREFIVTPLVVFNYGEEAASKYLPTYHTKVEPPEDDELAMKTVTGLVDKGLPVATQWASDRFGIPLAQPGEPTLSKDGKATAYVAPVEDDEEDDEPEPPEPDDAEEGDDDTDSTEPDEGDGDTE